METEENSNNATKMKQIINKKRTISCSNEEQINNKKVKLFSIKEFRKQLNEENRLSALNQFLSAINESKNYDYVFEYLEHGGNCLELLQILELDSTISPVLIFQLVTQVLLRISAKYPKYHNAALESCRYLLNNYIMIINKMVNLSSTSQERKVCLKLLATMVMFSPTLSKDILLHVGFHSANFELLTKHTGEKESVRDHFIQFLMAFLVDGHYPTLSVLLEKKGFIASIISGLKYDSTDTVCLVVTTMKNHILENPAVSKTAKMKTFNTKVVRDIVNLYNWKGPDALTLLKKKNVIVTVDELSKSKVSKCVHDFLLVLCTSHKLGVIFKDHSVGLGKKNQNALMYTVLESLERPWEHSYACELVIKICGACPDLAKTMWSNLKPFLEPRLTDKWLTALKFAKMLIIELRPACIEFCVKELVVYQLFQVIQFLVAPLPVLKILFPQYSAYENSSVKNHVLFFILDVLKSLELYMIAAKNWLDVENYTKLKDFMSNYISNNFPDAKTVLYNCGSTENVLPSQFLEISFEIFHCYKTLAPPLLDSLNTNDLEMKDILAKLDEEKFTALQAKIINMFIDIDVSKFSPNTELFSFTITILLKIYYEHQNENAFISLSKLFKNTGIFEGCLYEVNIWINGILNLKIYDESVTEVLLEVLKFTYENILELLEELSKKNSEKICTSNHVSVIESLMEDTDGIVTQFVTAKHKYLSPMILGFLKYLREKSITKSLNLYSNFVLLNLFQSQTQMDTFKLLIEEYDVIPKNIKVYVKSWAVSQEICTVKNSKGRITEFQNFTLEFLSGDIEIFLNNFELSSYNDLPLNLLQTSIFYLNNFVNNGNISQYLIDNCEKFIKHLMHKRLFSSECLETVLGHPVLLSNVNFLIVDKEKPQSFCTRFLLSCVKEFLNANYNIEGYLQAFKKKLLNAIMKILHKPQKYNQISKFLQILHLINLDYYEYYEIISKISDFLKSRKENIPTIFQILNYCLENISKLCHINRNLKPLKKDVVKIISTYFINLNENQESDINNLSIALLNYFQVFPHNIMHINEQFFPSLLDINTYNKNNINLALFLLKRSTKLFNGIQENLDKICTKKFLILPLLDILIEKNVDDNILKSIFEKFEPSFTKAMQKPHKAGQHFCQSYKGLLVLVGKFLELNKCKSYFEKTQKYEVSEVFHIKLLEVICRKVLEGEITVKMLNNIIMTFIHFQINLFKRATGKEEDICKINEIATIFNSILIEISLKHTKKDLKIVAQKETFSLYSKYCLKFGVSGQAVLLRILTNLIKILVLSFEENQAKLIFDMLLSHSEFLDNVLKEHNNIKLEILSLFLEICKNYEMVMERSHVPILLAAYRAMVNECDKTILALLKMYEVHSEQTSFYDFKPFLWGQAAANYYSVRTNIECILLRQPKMGDVLDILQEDIVNSTIANYPLEERLCLSNDQLMQVNEVKCYDLQFLLPLFSHLLAPEQPVQTYKFTRSGALSLSVVALSSSDTEVRQAASHVLSRFHFHMEARQTGKDNLLWIRYVEAVCKGTAALPDFKLNNFAAIYLARMALVLTQPNHIMYAPLCQHLLAKLSLDFNTIPELYTFLHSSDISYQERLNFILKLLKDGLRTEKDLAVFLKSMAFKLFSQLYSSCVSNMDSKLLILNITLAICKISFGTKMLCENYSFLTQIYSLVDNVVLSNKETGYAKLSISKILQILLCIVKVMGDKYSNFMIYNIAINIVNGVFNLLKDIDEKIIYEILYIIFNRLPELVTIDDLKVLKDKSNDQFCMYVYEYGCQFLMLEDINDKCYYLRQLFVSKFQGQYFS